MSDQLLNLETAVEGFLARESYPTTGRIRELVEMFRQIPTCAASDQEADSLIRTFEARHKVSMSIGSVLKSEDYVPWLEVARAGINPYYWTRYRRLLAEKHLSSQVIATLDNVTDRTLGLLENPYKLGPWNRRGLVMGHVQSGKTSNYIGLMCKAADAGYKLIVVIAGIHNNLRNQTQLRIDEGFIGRDSARMLSKTVAPTIGVGRYDPTRRPVTFTNSVRDFNKATATSVGVPLQNLNEPAVFVIKKNSSTLQNLLEWLQEHSSSAGSNRVESPMLLIDDEADNASINIGHDRGEISRINGQIRDLLKMFERSCYVGYTATPFANIFIDPDNDDEMRGHDLFPRHFIISLDPPSNYFGATRVFQDDTDRVIRHIEDTEEWLPTNHRKEQQIDSLPSSLETALRTFVLGRAVRIARGHGSFHSSMLVNVSRFTNVQRQLANEIQYRLSNLQESVRINGALRVEESLRDPELAGLYETWNQEFGGLEFSWPDIQAILNDAVAPIKVVEVNSNSSGVLNYVDHPQGLTLIAVGGMSLSRGLTLEGLMVSYFRRNSMMYDTLMQMGRWFGYREGYDDLCRIWMPEDAEGWYTHITESIELLRSELRAMEAAGATPEEFGLKVRSHPDTLIVTARNKFGSGQKVVWSVGLGNSFVETALLRRDEQSLRANRRAVRELVRHLEEEGRPISEAAEVTGGRLLQSVPARPVIEFLTAFQNHSGSVLTDPEPLRRYIEARRQSELAEWDVLFAGIQPRARQDILSGESLGVPIYCQMRTAGDRSDAATLRITNKSRVASRGVEKAGLSEAEIAEAQQAYRAEKAPVAGDGDDSEPNYPDYIYRLVRKRPLLIVHLLSVLDKAGNSAEAEPVVAYSISFPKTATVESRVEYVVNTTWLQEHYQEEWFPEDMEEDRD